MSIFIGKGDRSDKRFGTAIPGAALVRPEDLDHPSTASQIHLMSGRYSLANH